MREDRKIKIVELYALVWQKPMSRLGPEFGLTGRGLAKICEKHGIPTPPRGHWVKKEAGVHTVRPKLPHSSEQLNEFIHVAHGYEQSTKAVGYRRDRRLEEKVLAEPVIPKGIGNLHPTISSWLDVDEHAPSTDANGGKTARCSVALNNLTDIDEYRLSVSSAFLNTIEQQGAVLTASESWGRFEISVGPAKLVARILQKMSPLRRAGIDIENWTAWPEHHVNGHFPTNDLKFSLDGKCISKVEYVFSKKEIESGGLRKFIACVLAAKRSAERLQTEATAEEVRARAEFERTRVEVAQQKAEEERWRKFTVLAEEWDRLERMRKFLERLRLNVTTGSPRIVDGIELSKWLDWADRRIEEKDPANYPHEVFEITTNEPVR